jgi:hypothetical protein
MLCLVVTYPHVSHQTSVPAEERIYSPDYRSELELFEDQLVEVTGRIKEFRQHPRKKHLETVLLVNLIVTPIPLGESVPLSHLWCLTRHLRRLDIPLEQNTRISFTGSVYAYHRLGGKSKSRGLKGTHDFSILPIGK